MDVTEAMRAYVDKKIDRVHKYYNRISEIEIILNGDGDTVAHQVEIICKVDNHAPFIVTEKGEDLYACIDTAVDKIERQLTRHKEKLRIHKGQTSAGGATASFLDRQEEK